MKGREDLLTSSHGAPIPLFLYRLPSFPILIFISLFSLISSILSFASFFLVPSPSLPFQRHVIPVLLSLQSSSLRSSIPISHPFSVLFLFEFQIRVHSKSLRRRIKIDVTLCLCLCLEKLVNTCIRRSS